MKKLNREITVGRSKRSLSGREVIGALFGSDKSTKSIANWALAPNQRTYTRNKLVWICPECSGEAALLRARAEKEAVAAKEKAEKEARKEKELARRKEELRHGSIADEFWRVKPQTGVSYVFFTALLGMTNWALIDEGTSNYGVLALLGSYAFVSVVFLFFIWRVCHGRNATLLRLANLYEERATVGRNSEAKDTKEQYWKDYKFNLVATEDSLKKLALRPEPLVPSKFDAKDFVSDLLFPTAVFLSFASIVTPNAALQGIGHGLFRISYKGYALNVLLLFLLYTAARNPADPLWLSFGAFWSLFCVPVIIVILLRRPVEYLCGNGTDAHGKVILKGKFGNHLILQNSPP